MATHGKFRKQIVLMVVFFLTILSSGVRCPEALSSEIILLRLSGGTTVDTEVHRMNLLFAKLVAERTQGKVKIEVYPAQQLFNYKDLMQALPAGSVDMADTLCGYWTGIVPMFLIMDIPFNYKSRSQWYKVVDSQPGEILKEEFEMKAGVKLLRWMDAGLVGIISRVPLKTLEDFRGKRIRGVGEMNLEMLKAMGASPVFIGPGEVYMGLQRGTIDGAIAAVETFYTRKYYEVAKYISCPTLLLGTCAVGINKKRWDTLPKDVQRVIAVAAKEVEALERQGIEKSDQEYLRLLKEKGVDIYDPAGNERDRWKEACKGLNDFAIKRAGEKAKVALDFISKTQ
jgi:tripartite ATP-independent transporter DctP family solute receptor